MGIYIKTALVMLMLIMSAWPCIASSSLPSQDEVNIQFYKYYDEGLGQTVFISCDGNAADKKGSIVVFAVQKDEENVYLPDLQLRAMNAVILGVDSPKILAQEGFADDAYVPTARLSGEGDMYAVIFTDKGNVYMAKAPYSVSTQNYARDVSVGEAIQICVYKDWDTYRSEYSDVQNDMTFSEQEDGGVRLDFNEEQNALAILGIDESALPQKADVGAVHSVAAASPSVRVYSAPSEENLKGKLKFISLCEGWGTETRVLCESDFAGNEYEMSSSVFANRDAGKILAIAVGKDGAQVGVADYSTVFTDWGRGEITIGDQIVSPKF